MDLKFISELLQALLLATLPPLAGMGVAVLVQAYKNKRAELTATQQQMLDFGVAVAVQAAEQLYKTGQGAEKKDYAIKAVESWAKQYGMTVDVHVIEAAIESAVFEQFSK